MKKERHDIKVGPYRGVDVALTKSGSGWRFCARVNGTYYFGGSYDTLVKKLDEVLAFEPFKALLPQRISAECPTGLVEVEVIGIDKSGGAADYVIREANGAPKSLRYQSLYPCEIRSEMEAYYAERAAYDKLHESRKAQFDGRFHALHQHRIKPLDE